MPSVHKGQQLKDGGYRLKALHRPQQSLRHVAQTHFPNGLRPRRLRCMHFEGAEGIEEVSVIDNLVERVQEMAALTSFNLF